MGIRWGNGIPSALRGTTAVYANGYAVRCAKPAVFPRRCSITLRHLPSDFSISTTDLFEAAYILGHHQKWLRHFLRVPGQATQHRMRLSVDGYNLRSEKRRQCEPPCQVWQARIGLCEYRHMGSPPRDCRFHVCRFRDSSYYRKNADNRRRF